MVMQPKRFCGLHGHTGHSAYDGLGLPKEHFDFLSSNTQDELQVPAMAITEHGHMNSYAHAYLYAKELNKSGRGFKFIPGCELYVHPDLAEWRREKATRELEADDIEHGGTVENEEETKSAKVFDPIKRRHHLVVLAKDSVGLEKLFGTVSRGYIEGFFKFPRVDYAMLKEHKGHFVASTACVSGDAVVTTSVGEMTLGELVRRVQADETVLILSFDEDEKKLGFKRVVRGGLTRKDARVVRLKLKNGKELRLTSDHRVMTDTGWVEAGKLTKEMRVLSL